jgi:hypothetical protein
MFSGKVGSSFVGKTEWVGEILINGNMPEIFSSNTKIYK